jgi:hypothetical protein
MRLWMENWPTNPIEPLSRNHEKERKEELPRSCGRSRGKQKKHDASKQQQQKNPTKLLLDGAAHLGAENGSKDLKKSKDLAHERFIPFSVEIVAGLQVHAAAMRRVTQWSDHTSRCHTPAQATPRSMTTTKRRDQAADRVEWRSKQEVSFRYAPSAGQLGSSG